MATETLQEPFLAIPTNQQMALSGNNNPDNRDVEVSARYVTKEYNMGTTRGEKIQAILNPLKSNDEKFWALKGISFNVMKGDVVGIIGVNGSGKSTLLNILNRGLIETTGDLQIHGETSMLTVYDGLRDNLTGRENIRLKSLMMGKNNKEIDQDMDEIIEFSELGKFIEQPAKYYSSGMRAKLGFAIAVHQNPDIMIIDEALSVGDQTFTRKALDKIKEFKAKGTTIFFVSHALNQIEEFTDKSIWIQYGDLRGYGDTATILSEYREWTKWFNALDDAARDDYLKNQKQAQNAFTREALTQRLTEDSHISDDEKQRLLKRSIGGNMPWWNWGLVALGFVGVVYSMYAFAWGL